MSNGTNTPESLAQGTVAEGYEAVREVFEETLAEERAGHSAQLAAYVDGRLVVDLWGGPGITGESLVGVYSAIKGAAHLVVALLVQEGVLELDEKVAHYWPEFGSAGKEDITLRELMAHRAGVIGVEGGFTPEEMADDRAIAARLAGQRPFWHPGSAFGYHGLVIAALTGEVVLSATGRTLHELYESRIRAPYGLDLYMRLPEEQEHRFLTTQPMDPTPEQKALLLQQGAAGPDSLTGVAGNRNHPVHPTDLQTFPNSRAVRAGGNASAAGVGSARGLARMYAAAIGEVDGRAPLLTPETAARFAQIQSTGRDLVFREHYSFGVGFIAMADMLPFLGARSFGHGGAPGSQAFADPGARLGFGYTRRRFGFPATSRAQSKRLAEVVRRAAVSVG
ncbi:serine hydrolase domain-containing protein [Streptomyces morookaense]|uniref:serine hydrolase domain-containing protein n=1 Tax=Streptomyces morookaense TaxID=1970 RepID=UPI0033DE080F